VRERRSYSYARLSKIFHIKHKDKARVRELKKQSDLRSRQIADRSENVKLA